MKQKELLVHRLREYGTSDRYPFHMPGHKRREIEEFFNPFQLDITEIEGFDNLHYPEGILKESMEWAADLYGADKTYYLINGSSCGLLAAICGTVRKGGRILVSRNCHKAAYHGIFLQQLRPAYVYPQEIDGLGIQGGILPEDVEKILDKYTDIQAVLIVSPTYDGIVSDVEGIGKVTHKVGIPLIVDEAHGAHFRFGREFPVSALELGADIVIQSVHKTLPSLTQTALLHIKRNGSEGGSYVDIDQISRYLHIYQSSSPSYLLLASIENSIFQMDRMNTELFMGMLGKLREDLGNMRRLRLVTEELRGRFGVFDLDCTKIVVSTVGSGVNGSWLERKLRDKYHLEMEMCGADYVTAITTVMDKREGFERLGAALKEIDESLIAGEDFIGTGEETDDIAQESRCIYSRSNDIVMTISEAMDGGWKTVALKESAGAVSGEFVYIYPPGIPVLAPGERIDSETLKVILLYIDRKLPVQGLADQSLKTIRVVDKG